GGHGPRGVALAHSRRSRLRPSREASLQNRHFLFEDLNFLLGSPSDVELGGGSRDYNVTRPWVRRTLSGVPAEKCAGRPLHKSYNARQWPSTAPSPSTPRSSGSIRRVSDSTRCT